MNRFGNGIAAGLLAAGALMSVAACGSDASASASQNVVSGATIIDVRTPSEYAAGHLQSAKNVDVESADFDAQIAALPKGDAYVVYCRSGNRSAAAMRKMQEAGFTNVTDGGAMANASQLTGEPVVN